MFNIEMKQTQSNINNLAGIRNEVLIELSKKIKKTLLADDLSKLCVWIDILDEKGYPVENETIYTREFTNLEELVKELQQITNEMLLNREPVINSMDISEDDIKLFFSKIQIRFDFELLYDNSKEEDKIIYKWCRDNELMCIVNTNDNSFNIETKKHEN